MDACGTWYIKLLMVPPDKLYIYRPTNWSIVPSCSFLAGKGNGCVSQGCMNSKKPHPMEKKEKKILAHWSTLLAGVLTKKAKEKNSVSRSLVDNAADEWSNRFGLRVRKFGVHRKYNTTKWKIKSITIWECMGSLVHACFILTLLSRVESLVAPLLHVQVIFYSFMCGVVLFVPWSLDWK